MEIAYSRIASSIPTDDLWIRRYISLDVALSKNGGRHDGRDGKLVSIAIQEMNCDILIPLCCTRLRAVGYIDLWTNAKFECSQTPPIPFTYSLIVFADSFLIKEWDDYSILESNHWWMLWTTSTNFGRWKMVRQSVHSLLKVLTRWLSMTSTHQLNLTTFTASIQGYLLRMFHQYKAIIANGHII